jgi:hypothetical protein
MKSEEDIWVPQNTINISCLEVFQDVGRGVVKKKHEVRICDRIVLELTVLHQLNIHFFPTLYSCTDHSFSKISPVQDQNINGNYCEFR